MTRRPAVIVAFLLLFVPRLAHSETELPYYLALGDSLSRGIQPSRDGTLVERRGYVDALYAFYRLKHPLLQLKKLGCSGETTTTMLTGGVCDYPAGNQLEQAIAFLQTHRVVLVTISIGGDNILHCINATTGVVNETCVVEGLAAIGDDLHQIVSALKIAAGPSVPIVAANYYDPILAAWVLLPDPAGPMLAMQSLAITQDLNTILETIYNGFGVPVADVARAFRITEFDTVPGFNLPLNVVLSLAWTWMGAPPPRGPDIHPNTIGYAVIAGAFARTIGRL